ncbi:MAG: molecular chaperone DnaJ [Sphingorhabdus sp.]
MGLVLVLLAGLIGWAVWSGKLRMQQVLPVVLGIGGIALTLRGNTLIGIGAVAVAATWYRGLSWRLFGLGSKQTDQYAIDKARFLLGTSAQDDAERIRARHRQLISENHPDRGGSDERASELNKARDLLLRNFDTKAR